MMKKGNRMQDGLKPVAKIAFALLVLLAGARADLVGSSLTCAGQQLQLASSFNSPLLAAGLLVALLIGLVYMISQMVEKPEWSVWSKNEAVTLGWSVLLIAAVMGAFTVSCGLSGAMFPQYPSGTTPAQMAVEHLDALSANFGLPLAKDMVSQSIDAQLDAMHYAYFGVPVLPGGGGLAYRANKRAWSSQWDLLFDLYMPLLFSLQAQKMAMGVLLPGIIGILLPAALLLRMIFVTRDVGNFLIALCFALYFALPLMYVISFAATDSVVAGLGGNVSNPFGTLSAARDKVVGDAFQRVGFLATQAILFPNLALVVVITMTMAINKALKGMVA